VTRYRQLLITVLTVAVLLLNSAPALAGGRINRSFPSDPGEPLVMFPADWSEQFSFPSDPGEPTD